MATFKVKGGIKLKGDLHPQGAKNEALQVLCATLLTPEEVIMENVPNIRDVNILIDLLRDLNVAVKKIGESTYTFKANDVDIDYLSSDAYKAKSSQNTHLKAEYLTTKVYYYAANKYNLTDKKIKHTAESAKSKYCSCQLSEGKAFFCKGFVRTF